MLFAFKGAKVKYSTHGANLFKVIKIKHHDWWLIWPMDSYCLYVDKDENEKVILTA